MHPEAPADAPAAAYAAAEQRLRQLQRSPEVFGHPTGTVEWIETHISWLLLAGDFVYKFKKPLNWIFWTSAPPRCGAPPARRSCASTAAPRRPCIWGWWR